MKTLLIILGFIIGAIAVNHYLNPPFEPPVFTPEEMQIICIQEEIDC